MAGCVARLDVDEQVVDEDGGHLPVRPAQRAAELAHDAEWDAQLDVVHRGDQALEIRVLILERRFVELDESLLDRGPEDDVAPGAGERRLRPRLQRRHLDRQVLLRVRAACEAPAVLQLLDAEGARIDRTDRRATRDDLHLALLARAVAAARRVDGDAVPARGVEDGRACEYARLLDRAVFARLKEAQANPVGVLLLRKIHDRTHVVAAACFSRYMRIQAAPHSSRPRRKSVARTASTISGRRESMIALVRPWLCATARNAAPSVWRPGRPNEVLPAPQVVFTPSSSRSSRSVSTNSVTARGSAPTGIASASMITSSGGMPWSPAAETIFFAISTRRSGSIGISSSFASPITEAPCFATSGRIASSRSSSPVTELTSALR